MTRPNWIEPSNLPPATGAQFTAIWWLLCDRLHAVVVTEADCRQIKPTTASAPAPLETQASGAVVASTQPAAASPWRNGSEIPQGERTGLWFNRAGDKYSFAMKAKYLVFACSLEYRPAPDDAKEGDAYCELRYWQPNTGKQPVANWVLVDARWEDGTVQHRVTGDFHPWTLGWGLTHWRLSREA